MPACQADQMSAWQVMNEDVRVKQLVQELARGPLPNWSTPPSILVLNKVQLAPPQLSTLHKTDPARVGQLV